MFAKNALRIADMESGHGSWVTGSPGQRFWPGRIGSRVSVSDPVWAGV